MFQIPNSKLYFGSQGDYQNLSDKQDFTIVHFCKSSYLKNRSNKAKIQLTKRIFELDGELFVDILDESYTEYFEVDLFQSVIDWLDQRQQVLVHCDYGQSRSPSFCMLYGSKVLQVLPTDFLDCVRAIKSIQPDFVSPSGISKFLKINWKAFNRVETLSSDQSNFAL
jgi:protein-tyrosine phosphatase